MRLVSAAQPYPAPQGCRVPSSRTSRHPQHRQSHVRHTEGATDAHKGTALRRLGSGRVLPQTTPSWSRDDERTPLPVPTLGHAPDSVWNIAGHFSPSNWGCPSYPTGQRHASHWTGLWDCQDGGDPGKGSQLRAPRGHRGASRGPRILHGQAGLLSSPRR